MKLINWQIESLQKDLQQLKERRKESFESIKEHWSSTYHNSLKDKCEMIYMLAQGLKYNPYSFREDLKLTHAQVWKTNEYLDFCYIYEGFGSPTGFVSTENGLFNATQSKHKKMWLWAIENKKEESSFEIFAKKLKDNRDYLIEIFNETVTERGSGVYSTNPYLIEFEEKKLKTGKFYIYLENTSRKSTY